MQSDLSDWPTGQFNPALTSPCTLCLCAFDSRPQGQIRPKEAFFSFSLSMPEATNLESCRGVISMSSFESDLGCKYEVL